MLEYFVSGRGDKDTGEIYASLWYPDFFTALSLIVALVFIKETRGKSLEEA